MASDNTLILDGKSLKDAANDLVDSGWTASANNDAIQKSFIFADFPTAFAFMTRVAFAAEQADHHPEWFNVYNRVEVRLTTHDASGVTARDLNLARIMEQACGQQNASPDV